MQIMRIFLPIVFCAMIFTAAEAQDIQTITREGQKHILSEPGVELVGARRPDVIVVEYFDYNCPYCKKLVPEFQSLLAQDANVSILYKEWPILGSISTYAAASALAAGWQGKYLAAHDALIRGPRLMGIMQVDAILQQAGIDMDALKADRIKHAAEIAKLLTRNDDEAHALNLDGTPGIVVGRQLVAGTVDANSLAQLIAISRHEK